MAVNFREKNKRVRNSLSDLGDLTALSSFQSEPVLELRASDAQLQSVDANSAHVVVTLDVVSVPDQAAAPAAIPVPQPETPKENTMNATPITNAASTATVTDAEIKPTAAPVAPAPVGTGMTDSQRLAFFGISVTPDHSFYKNPETLDARLHDLSKIVVGHDDRLNDHARRLLALEGRTSGGVLTVSEDQSWEHTGIKIATAAAVGAAVYTGVRLAQMAFGDGPTAE